MHEDFSHSKKDRKGKLKLVLLFPLYIQYIYNYIYIYIYTPDVNSSRFSDPKYHQYFSTRLRQFAAHFKTGFVRSQTERNRSTEWAMIFQP